MYASDRMSRNERSYVKLSAAEGLVEAGAQQGAIGVVLASDVGQEAVDDRA